MQLRKNSISISMSAYLVKMRFSGSHVENGLAFLVRRINERVRGFFSENTVLCITKMYFQLFIRKSEKISNFLRCRLFVSDEK